MRALPVGRAPLASNLAFVMSVRLTFRLLFITIALFSLPGCALFAPKPPPPPPTPPAPKPAYVWDDVKAKTATGPASVVIKLSEQRVYLYKGEELVGESKCSSGKNGFETPPGWYKITQKNKDHVSNLYGNFVDAEGEVTQRDVDTSKMKVPEGLTFAGAKMPYFQRFTGGFGMHAGNVPNRRASHGCVRLPRIMAERFFSQTAVGTPVTVEE
jgi:lipoprotein-anchoring transpeptidase ErfK/SrfK